VRLLVEIDDRRSRMQDHGRRLRRSLAPFARIDGEREIELGPAERRLPEGARAINAGWRDATWPEGKDGIMVN
jgi:hypothetical protein